MIKILWADDQIDTAKSFANVLASTDTEVQFVRSGEEALEAIHSGHYDLILTDLAMPPGRWGGLWLLEQLKIAGNDTAVIVVSGEGAQSETIQALRLGATDYVTKEQLSNELPAQIVSALKSSANRKHEIKKMMSAGENDKLEFKSTLRFNLHSKRNDQNMELSALKSITGFLNSSGGTLLIGVSDNGGMVGVELDGFESADKFQLHFWNLVRQSIGSEYSQFIKTSMYSFDGGSVFCVNCTASNRPIFLKWKRNGESKYEDLFFVRAGPQTELLSTRQAVSYINDHFDH